MKRITASLAPLSIIILIGSSSSITFSQEKPATWEVYFSPHGGCTEAIIKELNQAKSTVLVQAYSLPLPQLQKLYWMPIREGSK